MKPRQQKPTGEQPLFGASLELLLDPNHELVSLAKVIKWDVLIAAFGPLYAEIGRPGIPIRIMAGMQYLKHMFNLSDELVVARWIENPYWQYFCGLEFFQHTTPVDPSQISRWRKRIGTEGCEKLLQLTIQAGTATKTIEPESIEKVIVDTTVQPKAVAHPTDARLYHKVRKALVRLAKKHNIKLRQTYEKASKRTLQEQSGYAKAKQFKRAKKAQKRLKVMAGRVQRDVERKLPEEAWRMDDIRGLMIVSELIMTQSKGSKAKIYAVHAPEVECIAKGKAHKPYEFGVKVSLATTLKEGFIVGIHATPGNPYDGHTLLGQLEQVNRLTGIQPKRCHVDRGYKGHGVSPEQCEVLIRGMRRGLDKETRKEMKRRAAVEPEIGHMKADGRLGRNFLTGSLGDAVNALLCGAGHNLRKILARLRRFLSLFFPDQMACWYWMLAKGSGRLQIVFYA